MLRPANLLIRLEPMEFRDVVQFLVEKIEGCYNNVVGLPLTRLYQMMAQIGVKGF